MPQDTLPDFDSSRQRLARQRKLAEALRSRSEQPGGQMVSGHYVAPSFLEQLTPVANQGMAAWSDLGSNREEKTLGEQETRAFGDWVSALPRARQVTRTEQVTPSTAVDELGIPNPMITQERTETVKPTRADRTSWLAQGMAIPMARAAATKGFVEQLDMQPKALGESMYTDAEGDVQVNQAWYENKRMALEQRQQELEQRLEDRRLDREGREALQRALNESRVEMARIAADARRDAAQIGADARRDTAALSADARANRPPSDKMVSELAAMDADEEALATGIAMLENASGGNTGWLAGLAQNYIPGGQAVVSKTRDPETNKAIQFVTYLTDEIRHGRFGSALTATEKASAMQYLPGEYDDKSQILAKARGLQEMLTARHAIVRRARLGETTGGVGGGVPLPRPRSGPGTAPPPGGQGSAPPAPGAAPSSPVGSGSPAATQAPNIGTRENPVMLGSDPAEDYMKLAPGTHYFDPDTGAMRVKR